MLARPGNRHTVQELKEIEIQCPQQCVRCALFLIQLTPRIKSLLRLFENVFKTFCCIQPLIQVL